MLTRSWRDTREGIELRFWAHGANGPLRIIVERQEAVCFVPRAHASAPPAGVHRRPLDLRTLEGEPVDGLYCRSMRALQDLRDRDWPVAESDVKPHDRYLMERFVHAGFVAVGEARCEDGVATLRNPKLAPTDYRPRLSTLSLDIETRGGSEILYSIAGHYRAAAGTDREDEACVFVVGTGTPPVRDDYRLEFRPDARTVLVDFMAWLAAIDPDVVIGWSVVDFDLSFLERACRRHGLAFDFGRGGETATILQPSIAGQMRIARLPGRAVLDGIDLLKAGFWSFESFSLDNVAHSLFGTGKLIATSGLDKVAEIDRRFREDKGALADYNLRDCTLVTDIFEHTDLLTFAMRRAELTGLSIERLGGAVAAFDNLYLPRLHRRGVVAPDVARGRESIASPGGHVLDSEPGLYRDVLVFDFRSLYPSIIRSFNIDPLALAEPGTDRIPGFLDASFSREPGILPSLIESLADARAEARASNDRPLSQAVKIIMNSLYGVLGTDTCRFHSAQLTSSITRRGHLVITRSRDWLVDQGYRVIYGDTDSLFVLLGADGDEPTRARLARETGQRLMHGLNRYWTDALATEYRLESFLDLQFETHYRRFLMPTVRGMPATGSKKRYAGLVVSEDGMDEVVIKGLEAARTDWTPLAREFQRALLERVFRDRPYDDFVQRTAARLQAGALDDKLVYRKRLTRRLAEYRSHAPPHVQAARKLAKPGRRIDYVITRNGPEPIGRLTAPPDYTHYLERQLAPAADGVLQFLGTSFGALTDAQLDMF